MRDSPTEQILKLTAVLLVRHDSERELLIGSRAGPMVEISAVGVFDER